MENKIKYPAKLSSNNQSEYGIVDAIEISGHKSVNTLAALYSISDCILSKSKINTDDDAIGQQWYVISEHKYYQLDSWNNRNNINGWSIASISVYMKYIGSVTDYTDLPSNLTIYNTGYVYNIINSFTIGSGAFEGTYPAGTDVAWTGDSWNPLGGNSYVLTTSDAYDRVVLTNTTEGQDVKINLNLKNGTGTNSLCGTNLYGSTDNSRPVASGSNSIAFGEFSKAIAGSHCFAIGRSCLVSGTYGYAIGTSTTTRGIGGFCGGNFSSSNGNYSFCYSSFASYTKGEGDVSFGSMNTTSETEGLGNFSAAIGIYNRTTNYGEVALGIGNISLYNATDMSKCTAFTVGGAIIRNKGFLLDTYTGSNNGRYHNANCCNLLDVRRNGDVYIKSNTTDITAYNYDPQYDDSSVPFSSLPKLESANLCLQESINQTVYSKVDSISLILSTDKLYILTTDNKLYKLVDSVATVVEPIVKNRIYICELDQSEWRWDGTSWHQLNASQSSSSGITDDNTLKGVGSQSDPYAIKPSADTLSANDPLRAMVTKFNTSTNQKEISWIKPSYPGWTNFDMLFIKYFGNIANNNSPSDGNKKYVAFAFSPNETTIFNSVRIMVSQQFGSGSLYIGIYEKNGSNNPLLATAEFSSSNGNLIAGLRNSEFNNKVLLTTDKLYYIMFLDAANGGRVGMNQFDYPQISNAAFEMGYGETTNVNYSTLPSTLPTNYPFPSSSTSQTKFIPYMKFFAL